MLFRKNGGIVSDVIRCDEPDYLIWKWHPVGSEARNNKRENEIRWGSSLRVKEGSVAVFVYNQKGKYQDFIEGPFDEILSTKNLPVLSDIIGAAYVGQSPFQAEIYFINLAKIIQTRFAVPFFDVYDTRFKDFGVPVAVRGVITFKIKDYREFIKLHRLDEFNHKDFDSQIKAAVSHYVKSVITTAPEKYDNLSVLQLERQINRINEILNTNIQVRFNDEFGVSVSSVDISDIEVDKTSAGYNQLKAITQDITLATEKAKAEAEIKKIWIETEDYQEKLRIKREEEAYALHKQTQSANSGAYQTEKQAEVGIAGANALGQMGANGAGTVNVGEGGGGSGFNPAAMMTSIAMGSVMANNISGVMKNSMNGVNQTSPTEPPPVPETMYNIVYNETAQGPYKKTDLTVLAQKGVIKKETLVWKPGLSEWVKITTLPELQDVVDSIPPAL